LSPRLKAGLMAQPSLEEKTILRWAEPMGHCEYPQLIAGEGFAPLREFASSLR
jgi:hypothetical protein